MTKSVPHTQLHKNGLRQPEILTIAITGACNLACHHCWVRAGESSSAGDLPLDTVRRIVAEFSQLGGSGIRITGGEPLCHPDWLEVLKFSCSLGFTAVILQTNAMLLNDEYTTLLRTLDFPGLSIQISLDGATSRSHDLVRGEGAFSAALQGIEMLVQGGLAGRISIFFTEMSHNLHEIPALLDFADRMGINSVSAGAMVQCGRAAESSIIAPPKIEQYLCLVDAFNHDAHFRNLYARIGNVAVLEWLKGESGRHDCCTFIENPYLTPDGRLYPCLLCHVDKYSVTGVFKKDLAAAFAEGASLWSSLQRISCSRSEEIIECRDCLLKPFCAGGCMGRAFGSSGNLLAVDDRCAVRRAVYQHLCENSPL